MDACLALTRHNRREKESSGMKDGGPSLNLPRIIELLLSLLIHIPERDDNTTLLFKQTRSFLCHVFALCPKLRVLPLYTDLPEIWKPL